MTTLQCVVLKLPPPHSVRPGGVPDGEMFSRRFMFTVDRAKSHFGHSLCATRNSVYGLRHRPDVTTAKLLFAEAGDLERDHVSCVRITGLSQNETRAITERKRIALNPVGN